MSTNQSERRDPEPVERDPEQVEHPATYEAPSLSVIGVVTKLTQGQSGISPR